MFAIDASNDVPSLMQSVVGYNTTFDAATPGPPTFAVGSPFNASQFSTGNLEQRCVSARIAITSVGPPLYVSGVAFGYSSATQGTTFSNSSTPGGFASAAAAKRVSRDKMQKNALQLDQTHEDFAQSTVFDARTTAGQFTPTTYLGGLMKGNTFVYIPGDSNGEASVEIDMVAHWEVRGRTVTYIGTPNPNPEPVRSEQYYSRAFQMMRAATEYLPNEQTVLNAIGRAGMAYATATLTNQRRLRS
jgi:hypothetical protein